MADDDIGDVLVAESKTKRLVGIVTDRDIAIRAVAESRDPVTTEVKDVVSSEVVSVDPRDTVRETLELMRGLNVRRLPVVEAGEQLASFRWAIYRLRPTLAQPSPTSAPPRRTVDVIEPAGARSRRGDSGADS